MSDAETDGNEDKPGAVKGAARDKVPESDKLTVIGRITTVYGIKGWLKIHSYTDPIDNLLNYAHCYLNVAGTWRAVEFDKGQFHGKGLVAHIAGCDNREDARHFTQADIGIALNDMPTLAIGDYYWHQLVGLEVWTRGDALTGSECLLGKVDHLLETGANDVLVVLGCEGSVDQSERLIPYRPQDVVLSIDLQQGKMLVDWDKSY